MGLMMLGAPTSPRHHSRAKSLANKPRALDAITHPGRKRFDEDSEGVGAELAAGTLAAACRCKSKRWFQSPGPEDFMRRTLAILGGLGLAVGFFGIPRIRRSNMSSARRRGRRAQDPGRRFRCRCAEFGLNRTTR